MENRKVFMNQHNNLLELEEHMYQLVDVETPNIFRNLFPYDEIPKIAFNDRIVPHHMPDEIWITDTTFRDGQQSRAPYSTDQIVTLYDYFHRLGGPKGKIRQCEFFLYSKKDRDAVYKCMERGYEFPEVTSWIRASKKDFQLVKDIGMKETGILVSCSDYHIFYKLNMTRRQAMEHYLSIVRECLEICVSPRCHLEDITRSDIYGFVIPFCLELMKLREEYQIPVKVRVCDTMGRTCGIKSMRKKKMPEFPVSQVIRTFYIHYNNSAIALINCSLFNTVGFSMLVIKARSFVILPLSIVSIVAFSNLSAKSINS